MIQADDEIVFAPEDPVAATPPPLPRPPWRLLVVDDEPQVHTVTLLALANVEIEGRRLQIEHAYNGEQAQEKLLADDEFALILLDVVMTTDDEGLRLVHWLRHERGNHHTRVILRTGQPGIAPEREVMLNFDINDYQPKAELSAQRLLTAVVGSIRAWRDLKIIAEQRQGLEELLDERDQLLAAFERFVPAQELEALGHKTPLTAALGDHIEQQMTLLFLDIRSFTPLAERLGPGQTFRLLNQVFSEIVPILHAHQGIIDKYLGDGVLALFPEDPTLAVQAALAVLHRLDEVGQQTSTQGGLAEPVDVGIGIHCGPTVLGLVGAEERVDTTVIADAVNVAARIERLTRDLASRLIVSEDVYVRLPPQLTQGARPLGSQRVRGKQQTVVCWDLWRLGDAQRNPG